MEQFIHVTIGTQIKEQTKRLKRGRPSYNDPVRIIKSCQLTLKIQLNRKALKEEKHTDGVFPLVTNLYKLSKKEVLQIYKYQPYVEKRFEALKTELDIAPVYLKKPRRCAGLVHVYYIALVVASLIERSVRQSMKRKGIEKLPLFPEGRKTATPTCTRILEAFNGICWHEFNRANERICFPLNLTPLQKTLLELLDVPKEIYA